VRLELKARLSAAHKNLRLTPLPSWLVVKDGDSRKTAGAAMCFFDNG
jgi:hypothetical protein